MSRLYGNRWSAICAYLDSSTLKQLRLVSSEFCEDIYCEDISNRLSINLVCSNQLIKDDKLFRLFLHNFGCVDKVSLKVKFIPLPLFNNTPLTDYLLYKSKARSYFAKMSK